MDTIEALRMLLQEYLQLEAEIAAMEDDRQALRTRIQGLMTAAGLEKQDVTADGANILLELKQRTEIVYDEDLLRKRLGAQYAGILEPDPRKLRSVPPAIRAALEPFLDKVGTPSRQRIRAAIESGALAPAVFEGAFEKKRKTVLYVKKTNADGGAQET